MADRNPNNLGEILDRWSVEVNHNLQTHDAVGAYVDYNQVVRIVAAAIKETWDAANRLHQQVAAAKPGIRPGGDGHPGRPRPGLDQGEL